MHWRARACAAMAVMGAWACAAEAPGAPGRIEAVTICRDQAAVTRVVPVPAGAGPMEVVVSDLPARTVPESLHADGVAGVQIRAVRLRARPVAEEPREEVRKLDEQLAAAERTLRQIHQDQEVARKKQGFLETLGGFGASTAKGDLEKGALKTDELTKLARFVFDQQEALGKRLLELAEQQAKAEGEMALLRRRREALATGDSRTAREAVVFLEKQQPDKAEIRLGYLVEGVAWKPSYNLRASEGQPEVELEYNTTIQQTSGEDWRSVALVLSTATPTLAAGPPGLAPFQVTLDTAGEAAAPHQTVKAERDRQAAEDQFRAAPNAEVRDEAAAAANTAAAQLHVLYFQGAPRLEEVAPVDSGERPHAAPAVTHPLPGRHSLDSRSDSQTVRIASLKLPADFHRLAEPSLTRSVYRQARLTNRSDAVLLPGALSAYLDDKFAGAGTLPLVRPGQSFTAGFGVDARLVAQQLLADRQESTVGGNKELVLTYQIVLENFADQPLPVRVLDRIPVPAADKVLVSLLDCQPAPTDDPAADKALKPRNILRWDVQVPPAGADHKGFLIQYRFRIVFDKSLRISATRTITPLFALLRAVEPWNVELGWSKDETKLSFEPPKPGQPELITVAVARGREGKNAIARRVEGDIAGHRWLVVDLENKCASGARLALGLSTSKDWKYFESTPVYVRPGENPNVVFDLTAPNYKSKESNWEYAARIERLDDVRSVILVFYPSADATFVVRDLKLAR